MALDKYEAIRRYMKSRVGAPIVELCEPEICATDDAVEAASTRYWTALPYQTEDKIRMSILNTTTTKTLSAIKTASFGTDIIGDEAYFLGIGRWDDSGLHNIHPSGTNYFDQKLLGRDFAYHPGARPIQDPRYLADRALLHSSTEDLLFGEPDYRYDIVKQELTFIFPPTEGILHLWYNWGFCPSKTIELLPMAHFDLFKRMVTLEFLEIIIAARTGVTLNDAGFQIDVTDLTNKRDSLKEEVQKELSDTAIIVGVWG